MKTLTIEVPELTNVTRLNNAFGSLVKVANELGLRGESVCSIGVDVHPLMPHVQQIHINHQSLAEKLR